MRKLRIAAALCFVAALFSLLGAEVLQEVTVKDGDTLWSVANYYLKNPQSWPEILKYNNLPSSDPNVILPGMKLRVPILLIKENLRAAHLIYLLNDVRYKRKADMDWKKALLDMELYNDDGLRTLQESRAKVRFFSGEILQLDENSLIILRPEEKQEEVNLLSGGVRASRARIIASDTKVDPRIEPRGPAPDFRTKLKEDKTTLVEVYEGVVDVTAQGKTVTLTKGFGTEVKFKQPPSMPRTLPPSPDMQVGAASSAIPGSQISATAKAASGNLEFEVQSPAATGITGGGKPEQKQQSKVLGQIITKYHVQISTGYGFSPVIFDETQPLQGKINVDFKKYGLPDGLYYYRISYVDDLGFEGRPSAPVQFRIDTAPPKIELTTPKEGDQIDSDFIYVEGRTKPGSTLLVNGKQVAVDLTGGFSTALTPKNGKNTIALVATDQSGNASRKELSVEKVKASEKKVRAEETDVKSKERGFSLLSIGLGVLTAAVIIGVIVLIIK